MKRRTLLASFLFAGLGAVLAAQGHPILGIPPPSTLDAGAFFDGSVLHEIRLYVNSRDWQALKDHYLDNTYYPADFHWRDQVIRNVGIRSRGVGSRSPVKPGLRVDFNYYGADQEFLGLKSVVLRNNTQDPSNVRERISMLFLGRMGLPASREAHTMLYVNNEYLGLYTSVESVDKPFLKRVFGEDAGYLFNYENVGAYYFEYRGSDPSLYVPLPFNPETHESDPRPEVIEQFIRTINEAGDAVFRSAIAEYLDLEQFVRHVAIEVFLADSDGVVGDFGLNNFYLYRPATGTRFSFIGWDYSGSFASIDYGIFHNMTDVPPDRRNRLMNRVLSYPDLYNLYLATLLDCVQSAAEPDPADPSGRGWLEREIQREYDQIRAAARADSVKPFSNDEFERSILDLGIISRNRGNSVAQQVGAAGLRMRSGPRYRSREAGVGQR